MQIYKYSINKYDKQRLKNFLFKELLNTPLFQKMQLFGYGYIDYEDDAFKLF